MAAFALAEYRFKGNFLTGLYLALGIMIPIHLGTVAILELMVQPGLVNTLGALILGRIYFVRIYETGLSRLKRRWPRGWPERISYLLSTCAATCAPAMVTVAVFNMIPIWNDLWFPLILAPAEKVKTLTLESQVFIGQFVTNWNAVLSALSLGIMPALALYIPQLA